MCKNLIPRKNIAQNRQLLRIQTFGLYQNYPIVYLRSNCLFCAMSWVTELFHRSIKLTIVWHYTMAWLPASLLKTHRRLSKYATTMCAWFVYERRRYATMLKSNNSAVYGQKNKVWVLNERNILRPKLSRFGEIFCFVTKPLRLQQLHARNAAKYFIKWVG